MILVRYLFLGSLLLLACNRSPAPPPEVVVIVPAEPIPEPPLLPPEEAPPPPKIIGTFRGVPIPEQGPWTKTLPRPDGTFRASPAKRPPSQWPVVHGAMAWEVGPATLEGAVALTVGDKPSGSPLLHVELQVKSGRVRVFLKYLGDIYLTHDAGPGERAVLEGAGIPGRGMSLTVWVEALDGTAQLESVKVTSLAK